jgi:archaetidylinositol phosphate synthase
MKIVDTIRELVINFVMRPLARGVNTLTRGRLHPDAVTMFGFLMHIPIAFLIGRGDFLLAAILLLVFGLFDKLDGELARLQKRVTKMGGLLDAATDRMKEVFLYSGAAYYLALGDHPATAAWAVAACGASLCVSYVKSKGETMAATMGKKQSYEVLNHVFRDGLVPFEVRMFLLIVGLVTSQLLVAVVIIAVLASFTALQRLVQIREAISHEN